MCAKGHRYQKFNESNLFCRRCGSLFRVQPTFYYSWPQYPYWGVSTAQTTDPGFTYTVTSGSVAETQSAVTKDAKSPVPGKDEKKTIKGTIDPQTKK
jgi:hypothetical protein